MMKKRRSRLTICVGFFLLLAFREGGDAFHPPDGVYFPSISTYMGASVKLNTGPYFIYPPRKQTAGFKSQPVSDLCKPLTLLDEAIAKAQKEEPFRKSDMLQKFQDLVQTEAQVLLFNIHTRYTWTTHSIIT
jgi:hypothetical protein